MLRITITAIFLYISFFTNAQIDSGHFKPIETTYSFNWGNNTTAIRLKQYGPLTKTVMIHVHDDEVASDMAADAMLRKIGGLLIELENNGQRLMRFKKSGRIFYFDPNRIFTAAGLQKNLRLLNGRVTTAALSSVQAFAGFILEKIPAWPSHIIAIHNNENGKYSIKSYTKHGTRAKDALQVHLNPGRDPDNFFVVTDSTLYQKVAEKDFNIVWQNVKRAGDDGSLSIYFGRRNILYVNVEAQKGRMRTQVNMLIALMKILQ